MSLAILFHVLCTQHVSDINISIIRSLRLFCWITILVYCSLFDVCWSFGVVGLECYPCGKLQPATRIPPQPSHTETLTHRNKNTQPMWSQAPDDGCINVRNMSSIEEVKKKLNKLWHQVGLLFFTYHLIYFIVFDICCFYNICNYSS